MRRSVLVILLLLTGLASVRAEILETPNLKSCLTAATQAIGGLTAKQVIYVFDIDNTLLALNQNLGSVQWFRWQQTLINENKKENRVADTIDELLSKQGLIYHLSKTRTPEVSTSSEVASLQQQGHIVLYHTSRNPDVRNITERDLFAHGLLPMKNTLGTSKGYPGNFSFLTGPENQRTVSFQNGIYMSAGQDKGIWLKLLFEKTSTSVNHLVFIDDELKNLQNVERAFNDITPMTLCRYGQVDDVVQEFNQSDKAQEIKLWNELDSVWSKFN
ncbi:MAG: DUF2608 domain-containing protein [Bdellovibrionaceae bacterium]|nr:DUF2608 domain-containing protein [Pseudobdellovibrionaceae bacterium]